jgi:hypothetical protein
MIALLQALIVIGFVAVIVNEVYQQRLGVSPMPTMGKVRRRMVELLRDTTGDIAEFGSGWGGIAFAAAQAFPDRAVTGIEYSFFPYHAARLRLKCRPSLRNLTFRRVNFFDYPLHDTGAVLCYLTNPLMARLKNKFLAELPQQGTVISSTFFIPDWTPAHTESVKGLWRTDIFVYRRAG